MPPKTKPAGPKAGLENRGSPATARESSMQGSAKASHHRRTASSMSATSDSSNKGSHAKAGSGEDAVSSTTLALVQQLAEVAEGPKVSSASAKKVATILEELVNTGVFEQSILRHLRTLLNVDKQGVHQYLGYAFWKVLQQGNVPPQTFSELTQASIKAIEVNTETRKTALQLLLMLNLLPPTTTNLSFQLPSEFTRTIVDVLQKCHTLKSQEKRGFTSKTTWHLEKKARLQAHLLGLMAFSKLFILHIFPYMGAGLGAVAELIVKTAMEYSYKTKEVPIVRECLQCLRQIAEVAPEAVNYVAAYLPTSLADVSAGPPTRKDKEKKGKEKGTLPCWDAFATAALVKLCLSVLHKQGRDGVVRSPFLKSLFFLIHHPRQYIFSEAVMDIVKRSGMFYLLLLPDQVYSTKELLLDYTFNRIQNMLTAASQVESHVALRLTASLCEQGITALQGEHAAEHGHRLAHFLTLEDHVVACRDRFSYDPLVMLQVLKAQTWLATVHFIVEASQPSTVGAPLRARQLLTDIVLTISICPINSQQVHDLLKSIIRAMRTLRPGSLRQFLIPVFSGLLEYLSAKHVNKLSIHGYYSLLKDFLLFVDIIESPSAARTSPVAPLDIDTVPYQRSNGGLKTLQIVLHTMDGTLSPEASAAAEAVKCTGVAQPVTGGRANWQHSQAQRQARAARLAVELVRFAGDFANVMVNGREAPGMLDEKDHAEKCHGNILLLLFRFKSLALSQPHHILWEASLAILKISSRSVPAVRVRTYAALSEVMQVRREAAAMLSPLLDVIDSLMDLQQSFKYLESDETKDTMLDVGFLLQGFLAKHEKLKEHLAVYVRFAELERFKLLGAPSQLVLMSAMQRKNAPAPVSSQEELLFA
eukprot:Sspe_Gene.37312::Locus_18012_Transcript_1_2_Confidence_0.500_Length_2705::g.37312::m.37312